MEKSHDISRQDLFNTFMDTTSQPNFETELSDFLDGLTMRGYAIKKVSDGVPRHVVYLARKMAQTYHQGHYDALNESPVFREDNDWDLRLEGLVDRTWEDFVEDAKRVLYDLQILPKSTLIHLMDELPPGKTVYKDMNTGKWIWYDVYERGDNQMNGAGYDSFEDAVAAQHKKYGRSVLVNVKSTGTHF